MSSFVLVHGAWHGAWCWRKVIPRLERQGHHVVAPDLPGHGIDKTPTSEITLQSYVDCVGKVLDEHEEPVQTSSENFGRVPRIYIEALQDRVITMNTSHSPFFSAPGELSNHLLSVV